MDKSLHEHLEKSDIKYIEHKHPAVFTVEESKSIKSNIPGLHCKCLFLKDNLRNFYLLAMNANKKADMKILRRELNVEKLRFGSPEELYRELKVTPGSVSIFAIIHSKSVQLLIDKEVWDAEISGFHPNINTSTLEINHKNLEKFINSIKNSWRIIKFE